MEKLRRILALALTINMMFSNVPLGSFSAAGDIETAEQISEMQQEEAVIAEIDEPVADAALEAEDPQGDLSDEIPLQVESDGALQPEEVSAEAGQALVPAEEADLQGEEAAEEVQQPDSSADEVQPQEETVPIVSNEVEASDQAAEGTPEQQPAPETDAADLTSEAVQPVQMKVGDQIEADCDTRIELSISAAQNITVTADAPVDLSVCKKGVSEPVLYPCSDESARLEANFSVESGVWELTFSSRQDVASFKVCIAEAKAEPKAQAEAAESNEQPAVSTTAATEAADEVNVSSDAEKASDPVLLEEETEVETETEPVQGEIAETEPTVVETDPIIIEVTPSHEEKIADQPADEAEAAVSEAEAVNEADVTLHEQEAADEEETADAETEEEALEDAETDEAEDEAGLENEEEPDPEVEEEPDDVNEEETEAEPAGTPAVVEMPVTIQEYPDGDALYHQLFGLRLKKMAAGRKTARTLSSAPAEEEAEGGLQQGSHSGYQVLDLTPAADTEAETYHVDLTLPEAINMLGDEYANVQDIRTDLQVYHVVYAEDGTPSAEPVSNLTWKEQDGQLQALSFDTDGFSPYIIKYTVEFHYGANDYSIPGESQILLSELIEKLQIQHDGLLLDVEQVESVSFTDEKALNVQPVSGLITYNGVENVRVDGKDFLLTSSAPITKEENLIITLTGGETFVVGVVTLTEDDFSVQNLPEDQVESLIGSEQANALSQETVLSENGAETISGYSAFDISLTNERLSNADGYYVPVTLDEPIDLLEMNGVELNNVALRLYHVKGQELQPVENVDFHLQGSVLQGFSFSTDGFSPYVLSYSLTYSGKTLTMQPGESKTAKEIIDELNISYKITTGNYKGTYYIYDDTAGGEDERPNKMAIELSGSGATSMMKLELNEEKPEDSTITCTDQYAFGAASFTLRFRAQKRLTNGKWSSDITSFSVTVKIALPAVPSGEYVYDHMKYTVSGTTQANVAATLVGKEDPAYEVGDLQVPAYLPLLYDNETESYYPIDRAEDYPDAITLNVPVNTVGESAFENDRTITSVTFNNADSAKNLTVSAGAFNGSAIQQVTYRGNATNNKSGSFSNCDQLRTIYIAQGGNYWFREADTFDNCPNLNTLICLNGILWLKAEALGDSNHLKNVRLSSGSNLDNMKGLIQDGDNLIFASEGACDLKSESMKNAGNFKTVVILGGLYHVTSTGARTTLPANMLSWDGSDSKLEYLFIGKEVDTANIAQAFGPGLNNLKHIYIEKNRNDPESRNDFDQLQAALKELYPNVKVHYAGGVEEDGFYISELKGDDNNPGTSEEPFKTVKGYLNYLSSMPATDQDELVLDNPEEANAILAQAVSIGRVEYPSPETFKSTVVKNPYLAFVMDTLPVSDAVWNGGINDHIVTLKRNPGFTGPMINASTMLQIENMVIDGNKQEGQDTGSIINMNGGTLILSNGTVLKNNRKGVGVEGSGSIYHGGGAVFANDASVILQGNCLIEGNEAMYGGGIHCIGGHLSMTGGTVRDNSVFSSQRYSRGAGGGILLSSGAAMDMSGGTVTGNQTTGATSDEYDWVSYANGGGICVGAPNETMTAATLTMSGGTVSNNTSAGEGGGIYIQSNAEAIISAGQITGNHAQHGEFGGGGIYVNYGRAGQDTGTLRLTNVLITGNNANGGGGIAACETSKTSLYVDEGGAIYGNNAPGDSKDILLFMRQTGYGAKAYISPYMANGAKYNWTVNGKKVKLAELGLMNALYDALRLTANPEYTGSWTPKVIIRDNSAPQGGGIGSNGTVIIGREPVNDRTTIVPDVNKKLLGRDLKENETYTFYFDVYEETKESGYVDTYVGTGYATVNKSGRIVEANMKPAMKAIEHITRDKLGTKYTLLVVEKPMEGEDADRVLTDKSTYYAYTYRLSYGMEHGELVYAAHPFKLEKGVYQLKEDGSPDFNYSMNAGTRIREEIPFETDEDYEAPVFYNYVIKTDAEARKEWVNADGSTTAPQGGSVQFELYADGAPMDPRQVVTLDGTPDDPDAEPEKTYSEAEAWKAVWTNLPIYRPDENGNPYKAEPDDEDFVRIEYTVKELPESIGLTHAPENDTATLEKYQGKIVNMQGNLKIDKQLVIDRKQVEKDGQNADHVFYVKVSTVIGGETYYVKSASGETNDVTPIPGALEKAEEGKEAPVLPVSVNKQLMITGLPIGMYTVEEVDVVSGEGDQEKHSMEIGGLMFLDQFARQRIQVEVKPAAWNETSGAWIPSEGAGVIENYYSTGKYCVAITKAWDDANNQDGVRPNEIYAELYQGETLVTEVARNQAGELVDYVTLNEANHWTAIVKGVQMYDEAGHTLEYTWKEFAFEGDHEPRSKVYPDTDTNKIDFAAALGLEDRNAEYTVAFSEPDTRTDKNGTVTFLTKVTNTHVPETIDVRAEKVWAGERPDGTEFTGLRKPVKLRLEGFYETEPAAAADGETARAAAEPEKHYLTDTGIQEPVKEIGEDGTAEWTNLPRYHDGHEITYQVTEIEGPEEYTVSYASGSGEAQKTDGTVVGGTVTVTNTLKTGSLEITKTMFVNDDKAAADAKDTVKAVYDAQKTHAFYVKVSTKIGDDTWYVTSSNGLLKKDPTENDQTIWPVMMAAPLTISGLPVGEYTVAEVDANGNALTSATGKIGSMTFVPMLSRMTDTVQVEDGSEAANVSLVNKYTTGKYCIAVTKQWLVDEKAYTDDTLKVKVELQRTTTPDKKDSYIPVQRAKTEGEGTEPYTIELNKENNWSAMALGQEQMDENGDRYSYRWIEVEDTIPEGWTQGESSVPQQMEVEGTLLIFLTKLTNNMDLTKVDVEKIWEDETNQDGIRPEEVTVELLANGKPVDQAVLSASNEWKKHLFDKLPTRKDGKPVTYAVREINVPDGYEVSYSSGTGEEEKKDGTVAAAGSVQVINTHTPKTVDVTAKKVWDDNHNQAGKRAEVTLVLSGTYTVTDEEGNEKEEHVTIVDAEKKITDLIADETEVIWEGLPEKQKGQTVVYSVAEKDADPGTGEDEGKTFIKLNGAAYEVTVDGLTVTNSYHPAETETTVTKVWADNSNHDGKRPETLQVVLTETVGEGEEAKTFDTPYTLSAANATDATDKNTWSLTLTNLPTYKDGQPVRYSWSEPKDQVPAGYTLKSTETKGTVTTITNEHADEKTRSTVIKAWEDEKDQLGLRPETIKVKLYADNVETETEVTLPITDEAGNKVWEYTAEDLNKYNEKGDEIAYSWMEDTTGLSNGYYLKSLATVRKEDNTSGETETTTTITNEYNPEQVTRTVIKVWEDDADSEGFRPETLTVRLYKGERSAKTQVGGDYVLSRENNWSLTTDPLPKHENGEEIDYYFEEVAPANGQYTGTTETEGTVTILTNTHIPTKTSTTVRKIWNDAGNQDGIRPDHIDLKLFKGEGEAKVQIRTIRLSGTEDTWTHTESNLPKYENGAEIVYSWEEYDRPAGYQSGEPTLNAETGEWEITNTHTPKVIDVTAKKVWNDAGNQDGKRAEVTLKLSGTYTVGTVEKPVTIEDAEKTIKDLIADEAEVTWTGLPEKMEGQQVIYTVTETGTMKKDGKTWITLNDADYEVNISGLTVTNSLTPETTSASVKKVWQDEDDQDGLRPGALEVKLYANQDYLTSMLLAAENGWSATVSGLPKYDKGRPIEYEWQETVPEGYTQGVPVTTSGVTTLTNTHTPAETKAEVRKLWKDDDNRDGKRPGSVTMVLMKNNVAQEGQTVELNEANEWKGEITGLPKYEDGDEIVYSFMEQAVADYSISDIRFERIPEEAAAERAERKTFTRTTIENTYTPGRFCLTVVKVWNDNHDQDGRRPESVTVRLLANGQPAKYADGSEVTAIELNAGNNWTGMATGLPINAGGDPIQYSWEEDPAAGYTGDGPALVNLTTRVTAITNTLQPEETEICVTKRWEDEDNQDGLRPDYVTVELLANGSPVGETTVKAENGWTAKFEHLPKFRRGQAIEYKVREIFVPAGYEPEVTGSAAEGYTIINRHVPETVKATVRKVWDDGNDQDKIRPKELKVQLLSNGTELQEITLTAENGWTAEAEGLPKYSGGKEIAYTWTEETAEGYELISTEQNGTVTTLTNRHQTDTVTAEVEKKWADQENLYGGRPEGIQVVLKADGKIIDGDTLNEENGWTAKRDGLPAKKDGETISYSWEEIAVPAGYEMKAETASGKTVITNTWLAETTEATVKKVWIHNGNPEVPEELKVILTDGKEFSKEIVLNEENGWTATESGLPARDGEGQAIAYSWTEAEMPEGYTLTETSVSGSVTTFVNTYGIETSLTVKKVWNDGETEHEPITVKLMKNGTEEVQSFELSEDNEWTATAENLPVTEEGQAVSYSWQEVSVPGYVSSVTVQGSITVITNTPIPSAKGEFSASKTWTGSEGGSATLTLTGRVRNTDGSLTTVSSSSQTVSGNGTARWSETPLFTEEGQPIFYALTENGVAADGTMGDYISTITGDEESGYIVYNHAKPEPEIIRIPGEKEIIYVPSEAPDPTTSATVVKVWDDMDNAYNTRKDSIEVTLDNTGDTYTLSAANNWTVTVEDLKLKDESGNRIQYTWTEKTAVSGYTQTKSVTGNVTVITNRYRPEPVPEEPETIDASVKKVWDDDNNAYGTRPTDLNVTLSNGDTYTLNEANHWSATAENLPTEDADGNEIIYTWTEQPIPNYTLADTSVIGRTTVLTNRYRPEPVPEEPETVTVGVKKIWDDDDNAYRTRPANLTVTLSNGDAYTLNAGNGWSVTVEGLPAADASGNAIAYSWTEERLTNYTLTDISVIGNTTVLTNRYRPAPRPVTTTATVVKIWDDENNAYETRPANVRMTLSNGQSYTLNAENNWSLTVGDLPAEDAGGNAIAYTWTEQPVPGYTMTGMTVSGNTTVFTNRYRPAPETPEKEVPTTSATVVKVWDDDGNEYGLRPANIRVTLSNGQSYVLSEANNWSMTVEDLPAEQNGEPIVYTWTEQSVPGYEHVSTTTAGDTTIFTNRYRPLIAPPTSENRRTGTPMYLVKDYGTPLGIGVTINHVGDCYE